MRNPIAQPDLGTNRRRFAPYRYVRRATRVRPGTGSWLFQNDKVRPMDAPRTWSTVYDWSFPASTSSIALARNAVSDRLADDVTSSVVDDVRLMVSELVTNAIVHARSACTVTLRMDDAGIRVEIGDGCPQTPTIRRPTPGEPHGRGLLIIDSLADRWGVDGGGAGKTVWFELRTAPADQ